jgi:hypothetical protein
VRIVLSLRYYWSAALLALGAIALLSLGAPTKDALSGLPKVLYVTNRGRP